MTVPQAAAAAGGTNNEASPFPLIRRFLLLSIMSSVAFDFSLKTTLAFVIGGTLAIVSYTFLSASPNATNNTDASSQNLSTRSDIQNLPPCSRQPEHCATTAVQNGSNVLRDGLVAFSHTHKPPLDHFTSSSSSLTSQQRLSRLLTVLLSDAATRSRTPPPKGSTLLISLPHATLSCPHQAAALATLASHYTVIGIVVLEEGSPANTTIDVHVDHPSFPLPSHRVVCSASPAGRIAMGRQLQPQLVLELETSVAGHLERFGHTTVVYDAQQQSGGSPPPAQSPLGRVWLRALE